MDAGDAVVEFRGPLDGIGDRLDFGEELFHQVRDLEGIGRHVVGAGNADGTGAVGAGEAVFHAGENDAVKIEQIALGEGGPGLGECFHAVPSEREVDGFEVVLERLPGNGDAFG